MALRNFWGGEEGSTARVVFSGGTFSVQSTTKRTGGYALRCNPTSGNTGYASMTGPSTSTGLFSTSSVGTTTTPFETFYFRAATLPSSGSEGFFELRTNTGGSGTMGLRLKVTSGGEVELVDSTGTTIATTSGLGWTTGVWYRVEVKTTWSDSATGTAYLYPDDADSSSPTTLSGTGDWKPSGGAGFFLPFFGPTVATGSAVDFYFDDVWSDDAEFVPGKCEIMVPSADGTYTAWRDGASGISPYDYTVRDEIPATNSDFVQSTLSIGDADTSALESAASAGISGTVNAVLCLLYASTIGNSATFDMRYRSGSDVDLAGIAEGSFSPPRYRGMISTTKPAGGAWDTTALDALEIGAVEAETADRTRLHAAHAEVHFTEAAAAFSASGALTAGGAATAGTAEHDPPVFAADGAATAGGAAVASSGTHVAPTFSASGAATVGGTATAGTGTHVAPTFTGSAAATAGGAAAAGAALFATAIFSATGALAAGGAAGAATGTHVAPTFTATAALAAGGAAAAGTGTFTAPAAPAVKFLRLAEQGGLHLSTQGGIRLGG